MHRATGRFVLAVAAVTALATSPLAAQGTRFGIKGGVALANMYGDAVGNVDLRKGFTGGLFVDIPASPSLSFQPEVLYTQKGAAQSELIDVGGSVTLAQGTWEYDYVDIVALLKGRFGTGGVRIALYGGGQYSVLMSAKAVGDGGEIDLKDFTKSNDIGGVIGGSLEFSSGFLLDLRYSMGTTEIDQPPLDQLFARKQNVISAMVGIATGG
jgi:hypothetical protein